MNKCIRISLFPAPKASKMCPGERLSWGAGRMVPATPPPRRVREGQSTVPSPDRLWLTWRMMLAGKGRKGARSALCTPADRAQTPKIVLLTSDKVSKGSVVRESPLLKVTQSKPLFPPAAWR